MIASRDCLLREPFTTQAFRRKSMSLLRTTNLAALACLFVAGVVSAQEKKSKRSDLPPAVEKTAAEVSKGATIKGFSKETENGKTTYEVDMVVNGHTKDVEVDANGAVLEVEEQVEMDSLPAAVKAGRNAKAGRSRIRKVESLVKNGQLVAYEAKVETAGRNRRCKSVR